MLTRLMAGGLAAALTLATALPFADAANAASLYFYGPYTSHTAWHNGHLMLKVCHTKYKWSSSHHPRHPITVSVQCHWSPLPMKPPHHPKKKY